MAGATVGWNYQIGQLVLGVEGDYDWCNNNIRGTGTTAPCVNVRRLLGGCDTASNWYGTFRGRLGYAMDRIMVYGKARRGWRGNLTVKASTGATVPSVPATPNWLGWPVPASKARSTDNLTAKVEYDTVHSDYEAARCRGGVVRRHSRPATVNIYESMVRAGLNYMLQRLLRPVNNLSLAERSQNQG